MDSLGDVGGNTYMLELDDVWVVDRFEKFGLLAQQLDAVFVQVLPFDDLNNNK